MTLRPQWSDQHSVACSKNNTHVPHSQRWYFDDLPKARLQARSKSRRVRANAVESARCQAAAYDQAEAWEWKRRVLLQEEEEKEEKAAEIEVQKRMAEAKRQAESTAEEPTSSPAPTGIGRRSMFARGATGTCVFSKDFDGDKNSKDECGYTSPTSPTSPTSRLQRMSTRAMRRGTTMKNSAEDSRRNALEQQVLSFYDATQANPSLQPFADFYIWCIQRFNNLTRCWRSLDTTLTMKLSYLEFLTSLRKYEFSGDARLIFRILDRDRTGTLTYYHFDPNGAIELAQLKRWAVTTFGSVTEAFRQLDSDKNGKITLEEFRVGAKKHGFQSDEPIPHVFEMLDLDHDRRIVPAEMLFLDNWNCPPWLMVAPDFIGAEKFKRDLVLKYRNNPIIAWHIGLDKDNMMRVSWHEFSEAAKREHLNEDFLPGIWRAMDTDLSGWLSLREWDSDSFRLLVNFKKYCANVAGTIQQALPILDKNANGVINKKEFHQVTHDMGLQHEEAEMLFAGLERNGDGNITRQKILYLDKWNVDEDNREEQFWQVVAECLQTKHRGMDNAIEGDSPISPTSAGSVMIRSKTQLM